jgi:acetamidase/formamidase
LKNKKIRIAAFLITMILLTSMFFLGSAIAKNSEITFPLHPTTVDNVQGDYYLSSTLGNINWGHLPNRDSKPVLTVPSGSVVTIDTLDGISSMIGRDTEKFFGQFGVKPDQILKDAMEISKSDLSPAAGPHIVTGPIAIEGAEPGDVLKVDIITLEPRVPYGVSISSPDRGALPGEFPELEKNKIIFTPIDKINGKWYAFHPIQSGGSVKFPVNPFMGIMGVAPDTSELVSSIPPYEVGGNIDINEFVEGTTIYLPVKVKGGLFYTGDSHLSQGDGEISLTAVEGALRGTFRLTILKKGDPLIPGNGKLQYPFGETKDHWIPIGLNKDLDEATKEAIRESITFLTEEFGMDRAGAFAYLSAATDYEISQVVDIVKGVNGLIAKNHFIDKLNIKVSAGGKKLNHQIIDNEVYVPIRSVVENLGGFITWDGKNQIATAHLGENQVAINTNSIDYKVNGENVSLKKPILIEGRTMVPLNIVDQLLKIRLDWISSGTEITIEINKLK